jgi:hypothetical protein
MKRQTDCHKQEDVAILTATAQVDYLSTHHRSCSCLFGRLWSIRVLVVSLLLFVTISIAVTVWSINYAFATTGVRSVSTKARRSEIDNVLENVRKIFADHKAVKSVHSSVVKYVNSMISQYIN